MRAYHHTFGLEVTTSNCSNNYGPYQYPEKLIPLFLLNALHGRELPIYGDGMNVRDWLHVEDHCRGIEACLDRGQPGETYNIGGGAELPNMAVIDTICVEVDRAFNEIGGLAERYPGAPAGKGQANQRTQDLRRRPCRATTGAMRLMTRRPGACSIIHPGTNSAKACDKRCGGIWTTNDGGGMSRQGNRSELAATPSFSRSPDAHRGHHRLP